MWYHWCQQWQRHKMLYLKLNHLDSWQLWWTSPLDRRVHGLYFQADWLPVLSCWLNPFCCLGFCRERRSEPGTRVLASLALKKDGPLQRENQNEEWSNPKMAPIPWKLKKKQHSINTLNCHFQMLQWMNMKPFLSSPIHCEITAFFINMALETARNFWNNA